MLRLVECSVTQDNAGRTNSTAEGWVLHTGNMQWSQLAPDSAATTHTASVATNDAQISNTGGQPFDLTVPP
eukprot:2954851-Rhodomonas_salina.1